MLPGLGEGQGRPNERYKSPTRLQLRDILEQQIAEHKARRQQKYFVEKKIGNGDLLVESSEKFARANNDNRISGLVDGSGGGEFNGHEQPPSHAVGRPGDGHSSSIQQGDQQRHYVYQHHQKRVSPYRTRQDIPHVDEGHHPRSGGRSTGHEPPNFLNNRYHFVDVAQQANQMRKSQELKAALVSQIQEQEIRKKTAYDRDREASRQLALAHQSPLPGPAVTDERVLLQVGGVEAAGQNNSSVSPSVSPIPISQYDTAPSAAAAPSSLSANRMYSLRRPEIEDSYYTHDGKRLFDLEKREQEELKRKEAQEIHKVTLKEILQRQIEEKNKAKQLEKEREAELERLMEEKARRETLEMARDERERAEAAKRNAAHTDEINERMAAVHQLAQQHGAGSKRGTLSNTTHQVEGLVDSHLVGDGATSSGLELIEVKEDGQLIPTHDQQGAPAHHQHSSTMSGIVSTLAEIKKELDLHREMLTPPPHASTPLPIREAYSSTPQPHLQYHHPTQRASSQLLPPKSQHRKELEFAGNPFLNAGLDRFNGNLHSLDPVGDVLKRNRSRLNALRYARHHDDVLKAFLLQDSTAAMRSLAKGTSVVSKSWSPHRSRKEVQLPTMASSENLQQQQRQPATGLSRSVDSGLHAARYQQQSNYIQRADLPTTLPPSGL